MVYLGREEGKLSTPDAKTGKAISKSISGHPLPARRWWPTVSWPSATTTASCTPSTWPQGRASRSRRREVVSLAPSPSPMARPTPAPGMARRTRSTPSTPPPGKERWHFMPPGGVDIRIPTIGEGVLYACPAVAVVPRPDVRPFFETLSCQVPDEMTRWRKRRGSLTRDRRGGLAADPVPLSGAITPFTAAARNRTLRGRGQRAMHPARAVVRGRREGEARGTPSRDARLGYLSRDSPLSHPAN